MFPGFKLHFDLKCIANKIDLIIADLTLLKATATLLNYNPEKLISVYQLPEETYPLYLAANLNTDPRIVTKLRSSLTLITNQIGRQE